MSSRTTHNANALKKRQERTLVERMYDLHQQGIVIGLTGRTGSGCSTTAEILCSNSIEEAREKARKKVDELREYEKNNSKNSKESKSSHIECLKKTIIENYLRNNINRFEFKIVKIRHIILLYAASFYDFDVF